MNLTNLACLRDSLEREMKDYLGHVATTIKDAAKKSSQVVSEVIEHQDTQAAIAWTKQTTAVVADEAVRLGKEVARSDLVINPAIK